MAFRMHRAKATVLMPNAGAKLRPKRVTPSIYASQEFFSNLACHYKALDF
jgi:hypothetical protein